MSDFSSCDESFERESIDALQTNIILRATEGDLWSRAPQGKRIIVRMHSMLPQFKLTTEVLQELWGLAVDSRQRAGFLGGFKYSPQHYLSLKVSEWMHRQSPADYLIPAISCCNTALTPERLVMPSNSLLRLKQEIQDKLDSKSMLEPLDLCRTAAVYSAEQVSQRLFIRCDIVYPTVTLQFTAIQSLKLISTPLTIELSQGRKKRFQYGLLTLDSGGRVLPLLVTDPLTSQYPIVGVWVTGVPGPSSSAKYSPLMHPLVWAACVHFILSNDIRERISPSPETNTFLLLHFKDQSRFYEVSTQGQCKWKCASNSHEIPREQNYYFAPAFVTFLKEDQTSNSLDFSGAYMSTNNSTCQSPQCTSTRTPTPTSYPPRPPKSTISIQSSDKGSIKENFMIRSFESGRRSPSTEQVLIEQSKMLRLLESQIRELQAHVFQQTAPVLKRTNSQTSMSSTNLLSSPLKQVHAATNTTFREFNHIGTNTSFSLKDIEETVKASTIPKTIQPQSLPNQSGIFETPISKLVTSKFPSFSDLSLLKTSSSTILTTPIKESPSRKYSPLKYCDKESQLKPETTIAIPKIHYDSSSGSDEEAEIDALSMHYLR